MPQVDGALAQAVLYVDLLLLVPGEGDVQAGQLPALEVVLPFNLVKELGVDVPGAKEEPVPARRANLGPLLDERTNGATPVPGPIMITSTVGSRGSRKRAFGST